MKAPIISRNFLLDSCELNDNKICINGNKFHFIFHNSLEGYFQCAGILETCSFMKSCSICDELLMMEGNEQQNVAMHELARRLRVTEANTHKEVANARD